jgi:hypothetical protein
MRGIVFTFIPTHPEKVVDEIRIRAAQASPVGDSYILAIHRFSNRESSPCRSTRFITL